MPQQVLEIMDCGQFPVSLPQTVLRKQGVSKVGGGVG